MRSNIYPVPSLQTPLQFNVLTLSFGQLHSLGQGLSFALRAMAHGSAKRQEHQGNRKAAEAAAAGHD